MPRKGWPDWDVYVKRGCVCEYCGFDGTEYRAWQQLQIDHIIPQNSAGANSEMNKAVACQGCNRDKGFYDPRNGQAFNEPPDEITRSELIERSVAHIRSCRDQRRYTEEHSDMMDEIRQRGGRSMSAQL